MPNNYDRALSRIETKLEQVETELKEIWNKLDQKFVTQDQFSPVKTLVYGMVGLVMTAFMIGLLALVFVKL
jgi:hypothetical protein